MPEIASPNSNTNRDSTTRRVLLRPPVKSVDAQVHRQPTPS
jgi:hypothetical protein